MKGKTAKRGGTGEYGRQKRKRRKRNRIKVSEERRKSKLFWIWRGKKERRKWEVKDEVKETVERSKRETVRHEPGPEPLTSRTQPKYAWPCHHFSCFSFCKGFFFLFFL